MRNVWRHANPTPRIDRQTFRVLAGVVKTAALGPCGERYPRSSSKAASFSRSAALTRSLAL